MATSKAANVEFTPFPRTPKSHPTLTSTTYNPAQDAEANVASSRKGRLLGSIKALSLRRRSRAGSESTPTTPLRTLGKRKSAWELFSRRQRPSASSSSSEEQVSQVNNPRPASASASKTVEDAGNNKRPTTPRRRQSLSDIFGRVTNKVSARYSTLSRSTSQREFLSSLADPFIPWSNNETKIKSPPKNDLPATPQNHKTVLSLHLPGASFDGMSFTERVECMSEDVRLKQAEGLLASSTADINAPITTQSSKAKGKEKSSDVSTIFKTRGDASTASRCSTAVESPKLLITEERAKTPDDYLCALIEAHCDRSDAGCSNIGELSACPSPEKYQPTRAVDFLGDDCLDPTSRKASQLYTCGEGEIFEPSNFRDQRPTIQVREVDPSFDSQDFDPNFYNKTEGTNLPHADTGSTSSLEALIENDIARQNLRLTLAKVTKNFHVHGSEDTNLEQDDSDVWNTIAVGNNILRQVTPYTRRQRISSCEERVETGCFANKVLEESIHFRTPPEPFRFNKFSPKSLTPRHVTLDLNETNKKKSSECLSSPIRKRRATLPGKPAIFIPDIKQPVLEDALSTLSMPTYIDFPKTRYSAGHIVKYSSKDEAIAKIHEQPRRGYSNFCTYDPKSSIIKVYPNWAPVPGLKGLEESGHEILWLPAERTPSSSNNQSAEATSSIAPINDNPALLGYNRVDDSNLGLLEVPHIEQLWSAMENAGRAHLPPREPAATVTTKPQTTSFDEGLVSFDEDIAFFDQLASGPSNAEPLMSAYELRTEFLDQLTFESQPACSTLNYNEPQIVAVEQPEQDNVLEEEVCPFETEVKSDFARSFLGSQFSESPRESMSKEETLRMFRDVMGDEERELFSESEDPELNKTWFDLAKEYKATHPSRDSSGHYVPGSIQMSEDFKTWFDLAMEFKDKDMGAKEVSGRRRVSTEYSGSRGSPTGFVDENHASVDLLAEDLSPSYNERKPTAATAALRGDSMIREISVDLELPVKAQGQENISFYGPQPEEASFEHIEDLIQEKVSLAAADTQPEKHKEIQPLIEHTPTPLSIETTKESTSPKKTSQPLFGSAEIVLPLRLKGDQPSRRNQTQRLSSRIDEMINNLQAKEVKEPSRATSGKSNTSGRTYASNTVQFKGKEPVRTTSGISHASQAKGTARATSGISYASGLTYASGFKFSTFSDQLGGTGNTESESSNNTGDENSGPENSRLRFGAVEPVRVRSKGLWEVTGEQLNSGNAARTRLRSKDDQNKVTKVGALVDAFQAYAHKPSSAKSSRPTSPTLARSQTGVRRKGEESFSRNSSYSLRNASSCLGEIGNLKSQRKASRPGKLSMRIVSSFLGCESSVVGSEADTEKSEAFGENLSRFPVENRRGEGRTDGTSGTEWTECTEQSLDERGLRDLGLYG